MIKLTKYGSAILLADLEFKDDEYVPRYESIVLEYNTTEINGKIIKCMNPKSNPNYPYKTLTEERIARHKNEQKRRTFIVNYLKEHYPTTDYAKQYEEENKWNLPLRLHTKESLECEYLNKDKHHCNKKHKNGCHTCCFECFQPDLCEYSDCNLLKN